MFLPPRYYDKRSQSFISITRPGRARESAGRDVSTDGHTPTRAHHFALTLPSLILLKKPVLPVGSIFYVYPYQEIHVFSFIIVILEVEERFQTSANINKTFLKFIFELLGGTNKVPQ